MKNTMKLIGIIALAAVIVLGISCRPREESAQAESSSSATAVSANAVDRILDEWESMVDGYAAVLQRVMDGDVAAAAELEDFDARFGALETQLNTLTEDDFTAEQAARFEAILERLTAGLTF